MFEVGKLYKNITENAGKTVVQEHQIVFMRKSVYVPKEITIVKKMESCYKAVDDRGKDITVTDEDKSEYIEVKGEVESATEFKELFTHYNAENKALFSHHAKDSTELVEKIRKELMSDE